MRNQHPSITLISSILFLLFLLQSVSSKPPFSCDSSDPSTKSYLFCNSRLPIADRARDLISRLTIDEKISQLVDTTPAIPRLGIPAYEWWSEALHGVAEIDWPGVPQGIRFKKGTVHTATSFPQVILTAATFDSRLWYRIGQAIGTEARGIYNAGQATGMTFWAPNINVFRDPRWGRGQETPGEDPLMTGRYAVSFVRGIQGDSYEGGRLNDGHLMASACCKHFTAYDLDNWNGSDRFSFNAIVSKQDLAETYQPPFQKCIQEGKSSGIMCAYNQVNGVPNCADYDLLTNTARGQWGFQGYITADCDAVKVLYENQRFAKTPEDAVADSLKAGMDVDCGSYLKNYTKSSLEQKKTSISDIDRALHNLFSVRMRLGLFNGNPSKLLFGNITTNMICTKEHQLLALDAARNGIVLLKNDANTLPFSKTRTTSLAVIGPNANIPRTMQGNYEGPPCKKITPFNALKGYVKNTVYHSGCNAVNCTSADTYTAVGLSKKAGRVVLIMGLDQSQERESLDRKDLVLPGFQHELIESVAKAAKSPIVLVLFCGGSVDISFAKVNPKIGAILWAGYPGEAGGIAIAQILFGDHNPGGKLPLTWYPKEFIKVPMTDMRMRPDPSSGYPGRTYRFYDGPKVYEFGYGLSYTKYSYKFTSVTQNTLLFNQTSTKHLKTSSNSAQQPLLVSELGTENCERSKFKAVVSVENVGKMSGRHPVLLFVKQEKGDENRAVKQLVGFESVALKGGGKKEVEFELNPCEHFGRANEDGLMVIDDGSRLLVVGDQSYSINVVI
ncbi:probable beta-D-xylosidase 7 isoform X1 [Impatiens glandulifera]|uniref:probable beta-D-xylosidase 7 isoform X1 n=1 Tax=Impatiens glandulifera TaxID=253017 RepID=UPI001FB0D99F|nr:probable beta-D-xylosidase 7 isoform X1 [Impatiens glandulifera]